MRFRKIIVKGDKLVNTFGIAAIVARVGKPLMIFTIGAIVGGVGDKLGSIAPNVVNSYSVKGIVTLVPVAIIGDDFIVKRAIVGVGISDTKLPNITRHIAHHIAPLVHGGLAGAHKLNITGALILIICAFKQGEIMPNLLNDIVLTLYGFMRISVDDDIAEVVAKALVQIGGFRVHDHDIHCVAFLVCGVFLHLS